MTDITIVIRWNVPGLYPQNAHNLLRSITKHADFLTDNKNGKDVIYKNAIRGSNFKSLFKSIMSNQQNLN